MSERLRDILILLAIGLAVFLPGLASLPVIDRDEARYAQATVQMVETGDYLDIRFQDEARYKKPVGAYWAQVAGIAATGQLDDVRAGERPIWAQRLPSVVGALLAVLFTYLAGVRLFGRREALVGAALLAVSVSLVFEAHQAKTDALLAGACAAVLYGWVARNAWAVWLGLAAGVLLKGPVVVGVAGLAWLSWSLTIRLLPPEGGGTERSEAERVRSARLSGAPPPTPAGLPPLSRGRNWVLSPLPILTALLLTLPWFIAIGFISDGAFYAEALGRDFGAKLGSAQETHGGPPGYYLLTTLVMFWPGILVLPLAGVWAWRDRKTPAVALLLCWLVPMWVVLELVPTKLPHYTLPLYPALALLCGAAVVRSCNRPWASRVGRALLAIIGALIILFAASPDIVALSGLDGVQTVQNVWIFALPMAKVAGVALAVALMAFAIPPFNRNMRIMGTIAVAILTSNLFYRVTIPGSLTFTGSQSFAASLPEARVVIEHSAEPSFIYYRGTDTQLGFNGTINPDDVLVLHGDMASTSPPECSTKAADMTIFLNYADGLAYWLYPNDLSACDAAELETWRRTQAARATDGGS